MKIRNSIKTLMVVGVATSLTTGAFAQKIMKVGSWLTPSFVQNAIILQGLKKDIETATDGRVSLKIEYGLGHPKDLFDMVEDGVMDATWSFHGYMPGRFTLTGFSELPLYQTLSAEDASVAYWDVYNTYFADNNEHAGLYLGALWVHAQGQIHLAKPIRNLNELKGKKIRIGGGVQKEIADAFGVAGVSAPGSKVYEILQQGVADGVFMPYGERESLRLKEVSPYVVELNMYFGSFGFVINQDFLASLGADAEAVKSVLGRNLSGKIGKAWQDEADDAQNKTPADKRIISSALNAQFKSKTAHIAKEWIKKASAKNKNAEKALKEYQSRLK